MAGRPRLEERVAVVTGAGNGIGRGIALAMAAEGAALALNDIDAAALDRTRLEAHSTGVRCVAVAGDMTAAQTVAGLATAAFDAYGAVDVLVNNVGGGGGQG